MSLKSNSIHRTWGRFIASALFAGVTLTSQSAFAETKSAYFAGGCFWCIEKDFEHVNGVSEVESGYQGGTIDSPTYKNHPDYIESVRIDYDPAVVDYASLLKTFFRTVDPTDPGGQFCDRGHAYTTAIFTDDATELEAANAAKLEAQDALGQPIATVVRDFAKFWKSEEYHQNYYKKNPIRYKLYRGSCGRNRTVNKLWGEQAYLGVDH